VPRINTQTDTAKATNATATATVPTAGTDRRRRVHLLTAPAAGATDQLLSGTDVLLEAHVSTQPLVVPFPDGGLQTGANEAVTAVLAAGGAAVDGCVTLVCSVEQ
jgi:hypothetical protein